MQASERRRDADITQTLEYTEKPDLIGIGTSHPKVPETGRPGYESIGKQDHVFR